MFHVAVSCPSQRTCAQSYPSCPVMGTPRCPPSVTSLIFPQEVTFTEASVSFSPLANACFVLTSKTFPPVSNYFEQLSMQMSEQHLLKFCGLLGGEKNRTNKNLHHQRALTKPAFLSL